MKIVAGIVRKLGEIIDKAEKAIREELKTGEIGQEPNITDRFIEKVKTLMEEEGSFQGVEMKIRTLEDRGPKPAEKRFGADFCAVLSIDIDGFKIIKGFLSQAKYSRDRRSEWVNISNPQISKAPTSIIFKTKTRKDETKNEFKKLHEQSQIMLEISPDSYVMVYSKDGFFVVPAISVVGNNNSSIELYAKSAKYFFQEFLMCFIGDRRITAFDDKTLESLRQRTKSRTAFILELTQENDNDNKDTEEGKSW